MWGKPNQDNTPISRQLSPGQTVTVVDPRHPLCGRTLPLIDITQKPYLGRCCVVWLYPEVERYVPVDATDLEFDPRQIHPTPLSIAAVESLLRVFEQIQSSQQGRAADVCAPDSSEAAP
ncbi:MAG: hypothetical protein F6K42_33305 [Leptolyngbya sp. SIO1D8]|nr:hypothetical protein [Leptolyngbya sp. SIO1D8]